MWLISPVGFFSLVRKPTDRQAGTLTVRSRIRADLEQLKARYLPELGVITESATNDYRFRAVAPQAAVAPAMSRLVLDLDYPNFKDAVAQRHPRTRWPGLGGLPEEPVRGPRGDVSQGAAGRQEPAGNHTGEAYEESGLRVRLIRLLVDVRRTQTYTRYYLAERVGGSPADMGWESQCVMLVPKDTLGSLDLAPADKQVVRALKNSVQH